MVRIAATSIVGALTLFAGAASAQTSPTQTSPGQGGGMMGGGMMGGAEGPQTLETMQARQDMMFDRLDGDHDGAITAAELSGLSRMMPQGAGRMRGMISRADANNDARITKDEMRVAGEARFRQMDKNGDGVISVDERPQAPPQAPAAMPSIPMPSSSSPADPSQWPGGVPTGG